MKIAHAVILVGVIACVALGVGIFALVKTFRANKAGAEPGAGDSPKEVKGKVLDCRFENGRVCKPPYTCQYDLSDKAYDCYQGDHL